MKEFGDLSGDPVLEFCEDWMLADEVTHVKMGSDWLRRLTADDPERRERALDFQRTVDKLFSLGGVPRRVRRQPDPARARLPVDGRLLDRRDRRARRDRAAGQGRRGGDGRRRRRRVSDAAESCSDVSEITLVPAEFTLVKFDAAEVCDLIATALADTGFPTDIDVQRRGRRGAAAPVDRVRRRDRRRRRPPLVHRWLLREPAAPDRTLGRQHEGRAGHGAVPGPGPPPRRLRVRSGRRRAHRPAAHGVGHLRRGPHRGTRVPRAGPASPVRVPAVRRVQRSSPTPSSSGSGPAAPSTGPSSRRSRTHLAEADTRPEPKKKLRRESLRQSTAS